MNFSTEDSLRLNRLESWWAGSRNYVDAILKIEQERDRLSTSILDILSQSLEEYDYLANRLLTPQEHGNHFRVIIIRRVGQSIQQRIDDEVM